MKYIGKTLFFSFVVSLSLFITLQIDRIIQQPTKSVQVLGVTSENKSFCRLINAIQDIYCVSTDIVPVAIPTVIPSNTGPSNTINQQTGITSVSNSNNELSILNVKAESDSDGRGAVVSLKTNIPTILSIQYGTTPASLLLRAIESTETTNHQVSLAPLKPGVNYYYRIVIYGNVFDNNGIPYSFKTADSL